MARKITDESRIVAFFMKQPPAECALMQKTITHILANRTDVTQPAKKERKKRASKSAAPELPLAAGPLLAAIPRNPLGYISPKENPL